MRSDSRRPGLAHRALLGAALAGCTYDFGSIRRMWADGSVDASRDAARDASTDASVDVAVDTAVDVGNDARDASADVSADASLDAADARDALVTEASLDAADARDGVGSDGDARGDGAADVGPSDDGGCSNVRINEVQTGGASAADEFIELYNAGECATSLEGWSLRYRSATGTADQPLWTGGASDMIAAHGFFTVANAVVAAMAAPPVGTILASTTGKLASTAGGIALFRVASGGTPVDRMGYGRTATNAYVAMMPAPAPAENASVGRVPDGHDTGNNATDFVARTAPSPGRSNGSM